MLYLVKICQTHTKRHSGISETMHYAHPQFLVKKKMTHIDQSNTLSYVAMLDLLSKNQELQTLFVLGTLSGYRFMCVQYLRGGSEENNTWKIMFFSDYFLQDWMSYLKNGIQCFIWCMCVQHMTSNQDKIMPGK